MDSQLTLVASSPAQPTVDGHMALRFAVDNMNHTSIYIPGERTRRYIVESNISNTSTRVYYVDAWSTRHLLAHIERKEILPDRLTLKNGPSIRLNKWLKFKRSLIFPVEMQVSGRVFIWKKGRFNHLALYTRDDLEKPVAWFQKSRQRVVGHQEETIPAFLVVKEGLQEFCDEIVVACIILEHRIRMSEKYAMIQGF